MLFLKRRRKKNPACLTFRTGPLPSLERSPILPEAQLQKEAGERQLRPSSPSLLSFMSMGFSWPSCKAGPQARAKIPSAHGGPGPACQRITLERGCTWLDLGLAGFSAFAGFPARSLVCCLPSQASSGRKSSGKCQEGSSGWLGVQQLKIELPGRQPWRFCLICQ